MGDISEEDVQKKAADLAGLMQNLISDNLKLAAKIHALQDAVISLAGPVFEKPQPAAWAELKKRQEYWHQVLLEGLEENAPKLAAAIDDREPSALWLPEGNPQSPPGTE